MNLLKYSSISLTLFALAACGGSSATLTFDDVVADVESLQDSYLPSIENDNYVSPDVLPSSNVATFSGALAFGGARLSSDDVLNGSYAVSDLDIAINFGTDRVTGTAANFFRRSDEQALEGTLRLNADLRRDVNIEEEFGIQGSLNGTLEDNNGDLGNIEMSVNADVYSVADGSNSADFIFGDAEGVSSFEGSTETNDVFAVFVAEAD